MTIRESLLGVVGLPVADTILDTALLDVGLNGDDLYYPEDAALRDLAAIKVLMTIRGTKTIHEGTNIITVNAEAVRDQLLRLARGLGRPDLVIDLVPGQPRIYDGSHLWGAKWRR